MPWDSCPAGSQANDSRIRVRTPSASAEGKHRPLFCDSEKRIPFFVATQKKDGVPRPESVLCSRPGLQARVLDIFFASAIRRDMFLNFPSNMPSRRGILSDNSLMKEPTESMTPSPPDR